MVGAAPKNAGVDPAPEITFARRLICELEQAFGLLP